MAAVTAAAFRNCRLLVVLLRVISNGIPTITWNDKRTAHENVLRQTHSPYPQCRHGPFMRLSPALKARDRPPGVKIADSTTRAERAGAQSDYQSK
jgi:hypothetical protein